MLLCDTMSRSAVVILRSMLFIPGDSERKLSKGEASPADALILDLEDSVAPNRTPVARNLVRAYLDGRPDRSRQQLWVRTASWCQSRTPRRTWWCSTTT